MKIGFLTENRPQNPLKFVGDYVTIKSMKMKGGLIYGHERFRSKSVL